jgi:tRNA A-37 threonylcarbamoyl transferase component Bud32
VKLSRATLADSRVRVLSEGGARGADVLLVRHEGALCVVKDFAGRGRLARLLARRLVRRELRAYRQLAGHPAVPRVVAEVDDLAFAIEYRPGRIMGPALASRVPASFVDDLRTAVSSMHARGVVHLDLRHRSNALAGEDGRPVLIDFASAQCFRPGSVAARSLLPLLALIDRRAVDKWERQLAIR